MKFLCEHCKAKYQIADDKVAGRTVRMKCRKCGGQIEVRAAVTETSVAMKASELGGDATEPGKTALPRSAGKPALLARSPNAAPEAPKHGQKDGPLAGAFQRNVQRDEDATAAGLDLRELSAADEWYVAVNGVPVGPVRVGEVRRKAAMGAVTEDSLCWQEGMEEWRAIRTVTELAAVVREAASGGRASVLPSEPRPQPPGRPPPPKPRPSRAPAAPAAPAWSKPSAGPLAQARPERHEPQAHRAFDDSDEGQPTVVGRSALLDSEPPASAAPAAPAPWTNGAGVAADPFAAPAPDPFKPAPLGALFGPPAAALPTPPPPAVAVAAAPVAIAPPSVAPKPAKPMNPIVLGMMVMFGCFGAFGAWFLFGQTKPGPAPVASSAAVAPTAPTSPTSVPTDIPPPVASIATVAAPTAADAGPAKVATGTVTRPGVTSGAAAVPSAGKATASTDPALRDLINGAGTGPATGPGGAGGGGGPKLTEDDVRGLVMQKQTQLKRTCWEKSGSTVPSVNVLVHIVVNGSGTVTAATATGNDPVVGHCLETQIKQWHWPGGGEVDVPFHFLRQ